MTGMIGEGFAGYDDAPAVDVLRTPPQNVSAEMSVLGAAMLSKAAMEDLAGRLRPEDFFRPGHQWIWSAMLALHGRGEPIDAETVPAELDRRGELERSGGLIYLGDLLSHVPSATNAGHYARLVIEKSLDRQLIDAGARVAELGWGGGASVSQAQSLVMALEGPQSDHGRMIGPIVADVLEEAAAGREAVATRSWGYRDDLPPMVCGQMAIVAGRPGSGKTTSSIDAARHVAVDLGLPVAFFSLEMLQSEVGAKVIAAEAKIPLPNVHKGEMRKEDWDRWLKRNDVVCDAPLYVNDFTEANPAYIRSTCMRLQREHGPLGLVVVDHIGLMDDSGAPMSKSRQQVVSDFSRQLKLLAKDLKTAPVLVCCQLNRGPEARDKKIPAVSDLRESGSLEQDAYQVLLVHRPDMYEKESERAGQADFIVGKNRGGPQGQTVTLTAQLHYSRFVSRGDEYL